MCTPINGFAKITYVYGIIRARNADSVSTITWILSVLTNLCKCLFRIFNFCNQLIVFKYI